MRTRRKNSPKEAAWKLLKICKLDTDPNITVRHPKVAKAVKTVGVANALKFLSGQTEEKRDMMERGKRIPGSFQSRC